MLASIESTASIIGASQSIIAIYRDMKTSSNIITTINCASIVIIARNICVLASLYRITSGGNASIGYAGNRSEFTSDGLDTAILSANIVIIANSGIMIASSNSITVIIGASVIIIAIYL
jgi:hypothetical protein